MKDKLIALLETFKYPVFLTGTFPGETYPESFFTFFNDDSNSRMYYDNGDNQCVWRFSVLFCSTDPTLVNTVTPQAIKLLKQNGFIISGQGIDVTSDEITHTARGFDALIIENLNKEETLNG